MSSSKGFFVLCLLLAMLAGCSFEQMLEKFEPKEDSRFAKEYLENLRERNFDEVKKHLSRDLLTADIDFKLSETAAYFPEGEPTDVKTVGFNVVNFSGRRKTSISYQYTFPDGWALADVALVNEDGKITVMGTHINRLEQSLEEANAFTFRGKGVVHYLFLILVFVIPLFVLYSLVLCIRTPMKRRKWLWIIFVLLGVVGFNLNWTSGQVAIQALSIHLLGTGAMRASPYAPWIMTISIPIGSILFLIKRKSLNMEKAVEPAPPAIP
jgi:hypothetical protein